MLTHPLISVNTEVLDFGGVVPPCVRLGLLPERHPMEPGHLSLRVLELGLELLAAEQRSAQLIFQAADLLAKLIALGDAARWAGRSRAPPTDREIAAIAVLGELIAVDRKPCRQPVAEAPPR